MGLDLKQQALPEHWSLLARARADRDLGCRLQFLPWHLSEMYRGREHPWGRDEEDLALEEDCRALMNEVPDLGSLQVDLERGWDVVQWLLSGDRRSGRKREDLGTIAVRGEQEFARGVRASQGHPLMWTTPGMVEVVSVFLSEVSDSTIEKIFDPDRMEADCCYKSFSGRDDHGELVRVKRHIADMRALYATAADRKYGVLVVVG